MAVAAKVQWPKFQILGSETGGQGETFTGKAWLTPEQTLVEFISTSAAYHGVLQQPLRSLEWELLKVFPSNVMPANAAAWYMAKRKFYMNESFDQQLLPFLMKKFPDKFRVLGKNVIFLEVYDKEAARQKLQYLVQAGLHAYFSHKADEYGVYFFDPHYYEDTEPFYASLKLVCPKATKATLVPSFFASEGMKEQFSYRRHTGFLVSISKQSAGVKVVTNTTGVIVSMINSQYGFIKFGASEKALFCAKSLYKDGWQFSGDPLKLPAMKFDGYQIQKETRPGSGGDKASHSWYAVLVWCGRRPSPQHCSSAEDLNSTPVFRQGRRSSTGEGGARLRQPSSSMCVGQVIEVRRDGAVVRVREDAPDRVWVPGWRRRLANSTRQWISSVDGECIGQGDMVAYYVSLEARSGYSAVGRNVMVLKKSEAGAGRRRCTEGSEAEMFKICERSRRREDDSDTDSDVTVSEGELEWLDTDLGSIIAVEDPRAKTMELLKAVQGGLQEVRGGQGRRRSGGRKGDRPGYKPLQEGEESFWRMRKILAAVEKEYRSDSDPDYRPGDEVDDEEEDVEDDVEDMKQTEEETGDTSFTNNDSSAGGRRKPRRRQMSGLSLASSGQSSGGREGRQRRPGGRLPYWVQACSREDVFDPRCGKFVPIDRNYDEEKDPDYVLPDSDIDFSGSETEVEEDFEEEVRLLLEEAEQPVQEESLGEGTVSKPVVSPVKVILTPAKEAEEEGTEEAEEPGKTEEDEAITLISGDDEAVQLASRRYTPPLWVRELVQTEQVEEYDSGEDSEYVPPPTCLDTSLEYDEYSDEEDVIPPAEVSSLLQESAAPLSPPSEYVAIWVKVPSAEERIARAKEQHAEQVLHEETLKEETSGKDTDDKTSDVKGVVEGLVKLSLISGLTVTKVSVPMEPIEAAEVTMEKSPSPAVKTPEKVVEDGHDEEVD